MGFALLRTAVCRCPNYHLPSANVRIIYKRSGPEIKSPRTANFPANYFAEEKLRRVSAREPGGYTWLPAGGVGERPKPPVLKTGEPPGSVGSNPTPSANRHG